MSQGGTGIAGAMDYHPAATTPETHCFVCGGPWKGGSSIAARVLPPLVQVCSAECRADPRFANPTALNLELDPMATVTLTNPFSHVTVEHDISGLTQAQLDHYAPLMAEEDREAVHDEMAPCTPTEFLAAWVEKVGPDEAGRVILGS